MVHWYKRDPHAAIEGMLGLTMEERGAYNTLLDMLYARDGNVPNDDRLLAVAQQCDPRTWRRVRDSLIAKGKVRMTSGGLLTANRVEITLKEVGEFSKIQSSRARKRWKKSEKPSDNNKPEMPLLAMPPGNASTSTSTSTSRREEEALKRASSSPDGHPLGFESERSPDDGELASAMGDARRSPPSVDPPLNEPEGKKRLSEAERAEHVARVLGVKPKRFPESDHPPIAPTPAADLVAEEPPIKPSTALLQTPLVQKANGHGNPEAPLSRAEVGKPNGWEWETPRKKPAKVDFAALLAEPDDSQEKVA